MTALMLGIDFNYVLEGGRYHNRKLRVSCDSESFRRNSNKIMSCFFNFFDKKSKKLNI